MKVLIDDKIPYIRQAAQLLFDQVAYLPGAQFANSAELQDADALIIRTRTQCNRQLLQHTPVKFIATATIGFDHINTQDLQSLGIQWTNCPGCNAASVAQYIRNSLIVITRRLGIQMQDLCVGIVGYGHVGRQVYHALQQAGCTLLVNDPPLQAQGTSDIPLVSLDHIAAHCNVITFHTPLTTSGPHPTYHLADTTFFSTLQRKPIIINAARGGVIDEQALLAANTQGQISQMVIDTWEHEPAINTTLLSQALIATPHIAGYSADGKSNATRMALRALATFFNINIGDEAQFLQLTAPPSLPPTMQPTGNTHADHLQLYNPLNDTRRLKQTPATFEQQRGDYPLRRETYH